MNGEWRGATTGAAMLWRPCPDFGPNWPEVAQLLISKARKPKDTYSRKSSNGVVWKMGAVAAH
ncbi:hypothetical protein ACVS9P_02040 [Caproicibacterium sp. NSD3]